MLHQTAVRKLDTIPTPSDAARAAKSKDTTAAASDTRDSTHVLPDHFYFLQQFLLCNRTDMPALHSQPAPLHLALPQAVFCRMPFA